MENLMDISRFGMEIIRIAVYVAVLFAFARVLFGIQDSNDLILTLNQEMLEDLKALRRDVDKLSGGEQPERIEGVE